MSSFSSFLTVAAVCVALSACGGAVEPDTLTSPETQKANLTVNRLGSGSVKSSDGIDCGSKCVITVDSGSDVTLNATPSKGYKFSGWSGKGIDCTTTSSCTVVVESAKSLTATFSPDQATSYEWSLTIAGSGTVSTDQSDSCTTDCSGQVEAGTVVTFTAQAASGYTFSGWSGSGISCSGTGSCAVPMTQARSLTATFTANPLPTYALKLTVTGSGSVGSSPAGIDCGSTCSANFTQGTKVTLAAAPASGYTFAGWTGGGCVGTGSCVVTVNAATSVGATFTAIPVNTYALNAVLTGSGTVVSSPAGINCPTDCAHTYDAGTAVTLTATPASGQRFSGWSGGGCSGTGTCKVTLSASTSVGATFVPITYTLAVTKTGSGSVNSVPAAISCGSTCSSSINAGTSITLKATPASGYSFGGWGGACSGTADCTVTVNAATNVTATFTAIQVNYTLSVATAGSGSVTSSPAGISCGSTCTASYASGTSVTLSAAPSSGYTFSGWSGACTGTGSCTVAMSAARSVTATFAAATATNYTLTVTKPTNGTIAASAQGISCGTACSATVAGGTSVSLVATPASGYSFTGWSGACTGTANPCVLGVSANSTVAATFAAAATPGQGATYYVDVNAANDNGTGTSSSPKKYIGSAAALMSSSGGDTVIVRAGTYTNAKDSVTNAPSGKAGAWNVIKAEVDGTVTITAGFALGLGDHYLQFEGLKWDSKTEKGVTGRYVKILRCAFKDGPATDNTVTFGIGTNDATPGAQYILVEDTIVYGSGGRYSLLVYNSDKIVLRRVVARHGNGWTDTKGDPQGTVSLYNSTDVLTQNLLIVDSGASGYFEAALYHPSNSRASSNIQNIGAMILNTAGAAVGWDDANASTGNVLQDSVIWGATAAVSINGAKHAGKLDRLTIGNATEGMSDWGDGGKFTLTNSVLYKVTNNTLRSIVHSNNNCYAPACSGELLSLDPLVSGLKWPTQTGLNSVLATLGLSGSRMGATVLKRLGVSGTLYGDVGYNTTTSDNLWPWPQEAAIKKSMCTDVAITTGFCAKPSLTQYVWEQIGTAMPSSFEAQ